MQENFLVSSGGCRLSIMSAMKNNTINSSFRPNLAWLTPVFLTLLFIVSAIFAAPCAQAASGAATAYVAPLAPHAGGLNAAGGMVGGAGDAARLAEGVGAENVIPAAAQDEARGGVYLLRDPEAGQVMRTGRTGDLARRAAELARNPALSIYDFEPVYRTDVYAEQRGLEQELDWIHSPPLNYIRSINPQNPNLLNCLHAANGFLDTKGVNP